MRTWTCGSCSGRRSELWRAAAWTASANDGALVTELTREEVDRFTAAVQPVYDIWRGIAGDKIVDQWLATIPK